jgi:hypothetical protein
LAVEIANVALTGIKIVVVLLTLTYVWVRIEVLVPFVAAADIWACKL